MYKRQVLERMTDAGFRRWTKVIVFTLAVVYLVRGGMLLWPRFLFHFAIEI